MTTESRIGAWLLPAKSLLTQGQPLALALIINTYGSTPREAGAWLLFTGNRVLGTIGGGNLEFEAIEYLSEVQQGDKDNAITQVILGPDAGQCCGGALDLLYRRLGVDDLAWIEAALAAPPTSRFLIGSDAALSIEDPTRYTDDTGVFLAIKEPVPNLTLFGAGHVAQALAQILKPLEWHISVWDDREDMHLQLSDLVISTNTLDDMKDLSEKIPTNGYVLVMTHSHDLDYDIVRHLIHREDLSFLGLIGSQSKAVRFRHRLKRDGISEGARARLTSPIGAGEIESKHPGQVALSVAIQLNQIDRGLGLVDHENPQTEIKYGANR